jgi:hypothetical protein
VIDQQQAPAALIQGRDTDTHRLGGWVCPRERFGKDKNLLLRRDFLTANLLLRREFFEQLTQFIADYDVVNCNWEATRWQ